MVGHKHIGVKIMAVFFSGFLQVGLELPVIGFGEKDFLSFVAPAGDMIECTFIFNS